MGALRHEHDVGKGDQAAAQPHGRAVDRGHDGHSASHHAGHDLSAVGQRLLSPVLVTGQLIQVGEVAARGERLPLAGQHDRSSLVVGIDLGEETGQSAVQLMVRRIEVIGPIQPDDPDRPFEHDFQLIGHVEGSHRDKRREAGEARAARPDLSRAGGHRDAPWAGSSRFGGELTIASVFIIQNPCFRPGPDRVGRVAQTMRGATAVHDSGKPRMRRATTFRWICDVPPMTLCARL